jgi:hypothetical protein
MAVANAPFWPKPQTDAGVVWAFTVAYLAVVEACVYIVAIGWEEESPATIYLTNGRIVPWLRYSEWLITCPGARLSRTKPLAQDTNTRFHTPRGLPF